jgi:hypothetical protein
MMHFEIPALNTSSVANRSIVWPHYSERAKLNVFLLTFNFLLTKKKIRKMLLIECQHATLALAGALYKTEFVPPMFSRE